MRKQDEVKTPDSCLNLAHANEMVFVLLARDKAAPDTIRDWIQRRVNLGLNKPGDLKLRRAEECACIMEAEADQAPAKTADGVEITIGMRVWVNSDVRGWPPTQHQVAAICDGGKKVTYTEKAKDKTIGAKASACWADHSAAMRYALSANNHF